MRRAITLLIIATMAQGFALGQGKYQRPKVETPTVFRGVEDPNAPPTPQSLADTRWFELFKDEKLLNLIREALAHNYDLREAVARIDEARAFYGLERSNQFPQITGSADVTTVGRSRSGQLNVPEPLPKGRTFGSILLNLLSFELDIWGRLRKQTEAARADLLASEEAQKAVLTTIVAEVAASYFALRELDVELEIAKRTLESRQESLRIVSARAERGVANHLELRQAEELVYSAGEVIPATERAIEQQENFLSVLIGKNPGPITRGVELTAQEMPPNVPAGLPSDLIARRPDILSAEESLMAAGARIEVARKAYLPQI